jgi:hypothetical protein
MSRAQPSEQEPVGVIHDVILSLRDQQVILDRDLAMLYGVPVKRLNEQVKRNSGKFPEDFAFKLSASEWASLRSQNATLNPRGRGQHRKHPPTAFTEHGALQAANVLSSPRANAMSVYVIRAFVKLREEGATNAAILKRLAEIDKTLLAHNGVRRDSYESFGRCWLRHPSRRSARSDFTCRSSREPRSRRDHPG